MDGPKESSAGKRRTASFLVRFWSEPGGAVRCYLRNLRTGDEQYLGDVDQLAARLEHSASGELAVLDSSVEEGPAAQAG